MLNIVAAKNDENCPQWTRNELAGGKGPNEQASRQEEVIFLDRKSAKKKARRRRYAKDIGKRNFKCGCGRRYASLAALFTHVKFKHGGVRPKGTTTLKKRGRPSVIFLFNTQTR